MLCDTMLDKMNIVSIQRHFHSWRHPNTFLHMNQTVILFIVILQYVFRQHNNIRVNVLLQHVSTQESYRPADYLRTINTLYYLQYYTCNLLH